MSASNWSECPKCLRERAERQKLLDQQVQQAYGEVSAAEYLAMQDEVEQRRILKVNHALREDFEAYTDKAGKFHVGYRCECQVCGFSYKFEHSEQLI